ncbi:fatty acid desaturase family protein [Rhodoferax aquaticus]|uniref:Acyl-CoA desaturase n=1 Tax=Rhodoferax aquaticus TaxID=2527691 RepID=A0A515EQJ0_9BURK|nr:acyl-CoA desaturase [Rhodoferax aquaticus]QDL54875.1 acyl-CoA desaturase [Rhodoferax aquaticus]
MQSYYKPTLDPERARAVWKSMQSRIVAQGVVQHVGAVAWLRFVVLSALLAGVLWVTWTHATVLGLGLGALATALLLAQFAFLGHDAGHGGLHRKSALNSLLGQLCMTVVTGMAFGEWYSRHTAHHRHCQDEEQDPDMEVSVVVSLTENAARTKGRIGRWFTRQQGWLVWGLSLLFAHSQRHLAQWGALRQPLRYWADLVGLCVHFGLWFALPVLVLQVDLKIAVLVYTLPLFVLGPYLAAIFWLNHIGMPLVRGTQGLSFLEHQAATSRTITNPKQWDWFFGGLNYQIEHHLFPSVPSFRLYRVQNIVRTAFAQDGIVYNGSGFVAAVRSVALHFRGVAKAL